MRFPWDATKPLRVEVALNPAADAPIWTDVSALVKGQSGVRITRGGGNRHEDVPPGRCAFTLDNRDGAYSDIAGAPPTLFRRRVRVSYRAPGSSGNLLTAEQSSFEGGTTGGWVGTGATLTNSSTRAWSGTKSLRIVWASGVFKSADLASIAVNPGYTYTLSAYVWVPAGSSPVYLVSGSPGFPEGGASTTTTNAWERISVTWTAVATIANLSVVRLTGAAAEEVYADGLMVDEGATPGTFTTAPAPISYRFTGRIATNDLAFPALGLAETALNATDESAWLGSTFATFVDAPVEEILTDTPAGVWPISDSNLGDLSPNGGGPMVASGTGATPNTGTDGTEFTGEMWLGAELASSAIIGFGSPGITLEATVNTTATVEGTIATLSGSYGPNVVLTIDADGKPRARLWSVFVPGVYPANLVSADAINDGTVHHVAATWDGTTGAFTLYVDGVSEATVTIGTGSMVTGSRVTAAGSTHTPTITGTVAYVAVTNSALTGPRIADHAFGSTTGFTGETVQDRVDRYNRWGGNPYDTVNHVSADAAVGVYDTAGKSLTDAVGAVALVGDGMAYVDGSGALTVRGRASFINPDIAYTIPGPGDGTANRARNTLGYATGPGTFVNDITGTMPGGTTTRATNAASVTAYGRAVQTVSGPFATIEDLTSHIQWRVLTEGAPSPIIEGLSVRMSQLDEAATTDLLAVDLGDVIAWTGMPDQAPAAADSGVLLGIEEVYTQADLLWTATVAQSAQVNVMVTNDPVLGLTDSGNVAGY